MTSGTRSITGRLIDLLSSLKLAIALLIILAMVSVFGTFIPQEQDPSVYLQKFGPDRYALLKYLGLIDLYHSWGFRFLMSLITLNLLVCTLRRLRRVVHRTLSPDTEKQPGEILLLKLHNELPEPGRSAVIERALADKGYSVVKRGRYLFGGKGLVGIWGDMVTHFSIILVIAGALAGSAGFVSTVNVYVGGSTDTAYNWTTGDDEPLGFTLSVENFNVRYYPVGVDITVRRLSTGEKVGQLRTLERGMADIPGTTLTVSPDSVDVQTGEALLKVYDKGRLSGLYDTGMQGGGPAAPIGKDYMFSLDSYENPMPMSIVSTVRLAREGSTLKRGIVEVNNPLKFEGLAIYQTAYSVDADGRGYTGFQIVRDPGLPLVWAGFSLLLVGLFISFFFSYRQVWAYVGEDRITMGGTTSKDWSGFMTEYGGLIKTFMQEVEP